MLFKHKARLINTLSCVLVDIYVIKRFCIHQFLRCITEINIMTKLKYTLLGSGNQ